MGAANGNPAGSIGVEFARPGVAIRRWNTESDKCWRPATIASISDGVARPVPLQVSLCMLLLLVPRVSLTLLY